MSRNLLISPNPSVYNKSGDILVNQFSKKEKKPNKPWFTAFAGFHGIKLEDLSKRSNIRIIGETKKRSNEE